MIKQLVWRLPLAIAGGLVGLWIFPTEQIWILAPLVPALILLATLGLGFTGATSLGFIAGQAFYISHIEWLSLYLGPIPLIALSTLMSIYFSLGVGLTAWLFKKMKPKRRGWISFSLAAASIWTLREWIGSNFPYGGFPWSRLGMSQANGWFANYAWWGGISAISFVIALLGSLIAVLVLSKGLPRASRLATSAIAGFLIVVPALTPLTWGLEPAGQITVAAVQGNANAGLFSNLSRGTILQNHLDATYQNVPQDSNLDLIVWPENASDLSPLTSAAARAEIEKLTEYYSAPLVFGTITSRGEEIFNSTLLWEPGVGPTDYYDKKRPVPFAEYVPDREFWRQFAPDLIDLVARGYLFGTRDGIYDIDSFSAGTLICFEIAEDDIPRGLAIEGAQVILSQTNNADFGYSDETYQQAAIAKLRAIETGRAVVNISTVGLSAIYLPDGTTLDQVPWFEPRAMVQEVPLFDGWTPATSFGIWFDALNALAAVIAIGVGLFRRSR
ncbi:apolipoprotein N-acyltransferase [Aquiluna borgnonia]|uniref:Apolipoprotein N-acyltransferase n=1 Tax=Aquiluna borgnonia TaxID=2499157 RepID=A0A7D4TKH9_9MICO|nr:apolipoprotein N-acyltransferase [Aquiluna borgnonia]QKJ25352.1 apolipoprotein N-acyltransferase [Aquiluna borgnonia]